MTEGMGDVISSTSRPVFFFDIDNCVSLRDLPRAQFICYILSYFNQSVNSYPSFIVVVSLALKINQYDFFLI